MNCTTNFLMATACCCRSRLVAVSPFVARSPTKPTAIFPQASPAIRRNQRGS